MNAHASKTHTAEQAHVVKCANTWLAAQKLPTYTELGASLQRLVDVADRPGSLAWANAVGAARELARRAGA